MNSNTDCKNRCEAIAALVLNELEPQAADELREHIDACGTCRSLYQALTDEEELIRSAVGAMAERSEGIQNSLVERIGKLSPQPSTTPVTSTLDKIFTNKIARLATAAVIIMAVIIGINEVIGPVSVTRPAFADIVRPLLTARTATFKVAIKEQGKPAQTGEGMFMEPGHVRYEFPQLMTVIASLQQGRQMTLLHRQKKATVVPVVTVTLSGQHTTSANIFETIRKHIQKAKENADDSVQFLGKAEIDQRTVVGYRIKQPLVDLRVWADSKTLLPVRTESLIKHKQMTWVMTNFAFDVELDRSLFALKVPWDQGYTFHTMPIKPSEIAEQELIEAFAIWAEVMDGRFPLALKMQAVTEFERTCEKKMLAKLGGDHRRTDHQQDELFEMFEKLSRGFTFVNELPAESQWQYFGKDVTFGDGDTAVFWYRPRDRDIYRVIYGDLSVRELAADELPKESAETVIAETQVPDEAVEANGPNVPAAQVGTCKGYVTDQQGWAVPNARVVLYHNRNRWGLGNQIVEETVSDANGFFLFKTPVDFTQTTDHSYAQDLFIILATHPDYALGWCNIRQSQQQPDYEVVLTSPVPTTIMVTDANGNPLPGVRIWPSNIGDRESSNPLFRDYLKLPTDVGLIGRTTDANGRATITNLPQTKCSFHATLAGYATGLAFSGGSHIRLVRGADVYGRVLTEDQKPVEAATVRFHADWMWQIFLAKSDSQGYFAFEDLPAEGWDMSPWGDSDGATGSYKVSIKHETYTAPEIQLQLVPDEVIEDFIIEAHSGTLIKCLVLEADANTPLAGARIHGRNKEGGRIDGYSDSNGVFTVRVPAGETTLWFSSPPDGVYVSEIQRDLTSTLRFDASGNEMTVTLTAPPIAGPLTTVWGIVLDPNGRGWPEAVVYSAAGRFHTATAGSYVRPAGVDDDGQFELKEVPAGRKLCVYAETDDRRLAGAGVFQIPPDPNESAYIEIRLVPTQKASVIIKDEAGNPVANVSLDVKPVVDGEEIWSVGHDEDTDERGLLEIRGIIPGLEYYLQDERFQQRGRRRGSAEELFKAIRILIPLESDPNAEPAEGRD
jgi:hypothetical protein